MSNAYAWEHPEVSSAVDLTSTHSIVSFPGGAFTVATEVKTTYYRQDGTSFSVPTPPAMDSSERGDI